MDLTVNILARVVFTPSKVSADDADVTMAKAFTEQQVMNLTDGTGANKADLIYTKKTTIGAGASTNYDLIGTLTDIFGDTINMVALKVIFFKNTGTTQLSIGDAAGTPIATIMEAATDRLNIEAGGFALLAAPTAAGYAAVAGASDVLAVNEEGGASAGAYEMVLIGATA